MAHIALIVILIVLFIANVAVAVGALIMRRNLLGCENNSSPLCPQYVCPSGEPATRTGEDGKAQTSG